MTLLYLVVVMLLGSIVFGLGTFALIKVKKSWFRKAIGAVATITVIAIILCPIYYEFPDHESTKSKPATFNEKDSLEVHSYGMFCWDWDDGFINIPFKSVSVPVNLYPRSGVQEEQPVIDVYFSIDDINLFYAKKSRRSLSDYEAMAEMKMIASYWINKFYSVYPDIGTRLYQKHCLYTGDNLNSVSEEFKDVLVDWINDRVRLEGMVAKVPSSKIYNYTSKASIY